MSSGGLRHILCALRGRPESRTTVTKAIELALEHQARLTYVHIINVDFLGNVAPTMTSIQAVYRQLESMSEFAMQLVSDRSRRLGVVKVDHLLRAGNVQRQLLKVIKETGVDALVIGRPIEAPGIGSVFTPQEYQQFVDQAEQEFGVRVYQVESTVGNHLKDEDYFEHYQ